MGLESYDTYLQLNLEFLILFLNDYFIQEEEAKGPYGHKRGIQNLSNTWKARLAKESAVLFTILARNIRQTIWKHLQSPTSAYSFSSSSPSSSD